MSIHLDPVLESLHTQMPISQHLNHFTNRHNTFWKVLRRYNYNTPQWNTRLTSKSYQGLKFIRFKVDKNLLQPEMQMFAQKHINKYYYISEIKCLCQLLFKESVKNAICWGWTVYSRMLHLNRSGGNRQKNKGSALYRRHTGKVDPKD